MLHGSAFLHYYPGVLAAGRIGILALRQCLGCKVKQCKKFLYNKTGNALFTGGSYRNSDCSLGDTCFVCRQ